MTAFSVPHAFGLSIFTSYFILIFFLFYIIISSISRHVRTEAKMQPALVFGALTLVSFAHTWFWMFRFVAWSFQTYEAALERRDMSIVVRVASWLTDTGLFEQAWSTVCRGPINWWWSEQLCLFTAGAFTIFLYLQRYRVPHVWAYMLLGQVVAISVALSLFNLALVLIPRSQVPAKTKDVFLPPSLTIPVLFSMLAISLSPYTNSVTFLPNLLAMHAFLILPLLPLPTLSLPSISPRATSFYTLLSLLSLLLRIRTTLSVLSALKITSSPFFNWRYPEDVAIAVWTAPGKMYACAWQILHGHPAQASIGWDVVWTSVVWLTWSAYVTEGRGRKAAVFARQTLQSAFASVGVVAPLELGRAFVDKEDERLKVGVKYK